MRAFIGPHRLTFACIILYQRELECISVTNLLNRQDRYIHIHANTHLHDIIIAFLVIKIQDSSLYFLFCMHIMYLLLKSVNELDFVSLNSHEFTWRCNVTGDCTLDHLISESKFG